MAPWNKTAPMNPKPSCRKAAYPAELNMNLSGGEAMQMPARDTAML